MERGRKEEINKCYYGNAQERETVEGRLEKNGRDSKTMDGMKESEIRVKEEVEEKKEHGEIRLDNCKKEEMEKNGIKRRRVESRKEQDERDRERKGGINRYGKEWKRRRKEMKNEIRNSDEGKFCDVEKRTEQIEIERKMEHVLGRMMKYEGKVEELARRLIRGYQMKKGK